ncbi:toll/interleukin-1 receptor domain-containing protein [Devosia submarina]|uniref:toll/interleukin-1 receptor domain-containing protein n=1 Tax=Devosia submarina TaxID=1173082 RepID=UPI000D39E824|nr:toll/interleukin-1 receptor domain-containing protein [Devosia submarina]
MPRQTIFISHAKPEDNDFVLWLGSRLIGEGYQPWAELTDLDGGAPFWANIERILHEETIRFVSVISSSSVATDRRGFRSELSIADGVGRQLGDDKFIIPVRLDDTPNSRLPAQLNQLHTLDFSRSWGEGYLELLATLERSKVLRGAGSTTFEQWRTDHAAASSLVTATPETAVTNLLAITKLPERVSLYSYEGSRESFPKAIRDTGVPHTHFHRLCIALADKDHIQELMGESHLLKTEGVFGFSEFLDGPKANETRPLRSDAKNKITGLLREHIERHLLARGLVCYDAAGQNAFFFPKRLIENDKVHYRTAWNTPTWKNVVGRSEKLGVYWHLAMKVNVSLGEQAMVRFKPYLCWSEDGQKAITDAKRTSSLRKRFCRNWWNPQWRTLQEAFVAFLANGDEEVVIDLGGANIMALAAKLSGVQLARSMPADLLLHDQSEDPEEPDQLDDDFHARDELEEEA